MQPPHHSREVWTVSSFNKTTTNMTIVPPLSIARTRALIEHCIIVYLLHRFGTECKDKSLTSSISLDYGPGAVLPKQGISRSLLSKTSRHPLEIAPRHSSGARVDGFDESLHLFHRNGEVDGPPRRNIYARLTPNELQNLEHTETSNSAKAVQNPIEGTGDIFKPLEDYIITSFTSRECINNSFTTLRPSMALHAASEGARQANRAATNDRYHHASVPLSEMDAKTLLMGNFAGNGTWWTRERESLKIPDRLRSHHKNLSTEAPNRGTTSVTFESPRIDWAELNEWYALVLQAGSGWKRHFYGLMESDATEFWDECLSPKEVDEIEHQILEAQAHTQRVLLKATESLLKRPGAQLRQPNDIRFLLIILANPLLYPSDISTTGKQNSRPRSKSREPSSANISTGLDPLRHFEFTASPASSHDHGNGSGQHSGIIKRVLGLLANLPNECHHHLVAWFARFSKSHFQRTIELVGRFMNYRLLRQHGKQQVTRQDPTANLIPSLGTAGQGASVALHATLGMLGQHSRKSDNRPKPVVYNDDWQIKAAARVMALLFSANNIGATQKVDTNVTSTASTSNSVSMVSHENLNNHGQILATSSFYNTLLDYSDLVADFEAWEVGRGKFSFCQYPFFLSIWAKIQIMEYDARRQMEVKAREAFFDSIMTRKTVNQYLVLRIRRECLVEDSLKGVSEVVGSGGEEIKKGLRIEFKGEEGIDAGGLRKEWFLLLVRDVFNPEHGMIYICYLTFSLTCLLGMFVYDEDSHFCYFNPNSFETSDQYFLVGIVLGLAIYHSTILDVALPPFAFRKLLAAGPTAALGARSHAKPTMTYGLEDLAELRPALANGLRQLLEYDGDVEETFCRDFVADVERYGQVAQIPLCPNGEKTPVTNANRREFVDLYVQYLLDTAVSRQFEPFKRGFFTVCGGNALSLFRPEEIELLIRGSDELLDIESLQAVAIYENWSVPNAAETEPVIGWFWHTFQKANPKDQRKLLSFITGSDRIPAMGAASLVIKLSCLGDDSLRFPVARTCFNMLSLWRYTSREKLEIMLWRAVYESEGFGLK